MNIMECKICGQNTFMFSNGTYYLEDGKNFSIPFLYCRNCNSFIRQVDEKSVLSHLKAASHTNIENEERFFRMRIDYFKYIFTLTKNHINSLTNWLDIGCSYGHLIEYLKSRDIDCIGIEISKGVRKYAQKKGLIVLGSLDDLPEKDKFDIVSLIDSLYYVSEPIELIKSIYSKTNPDSLLVLRITNRNWLAKIKKNLLRKEIGLALGDATISYSRKSIRYLLENNGFKILKISCVEKGKSIDIKTKIFYILTSVLNILSFQLINLSPGLIVIAKKNSTHNIAS